MSASNVKVAYSSNPANGGGGAIPVTALTPLPVTAAIPSAALTPVVGHTVVVTNGDTSVHALFNSPTLALYGWVVPKASNSGDIKCDFNATPVTLNGFNLPFISGSSGYDLSKLNLITNGSDSAVVTYFTAT